MEQDIISTIAVVVAIGAALTPLTAILTEAVKDQGVIESKHLPFVSLFLGLVMGGLMKFLPGHDVPISMLLFAGFVSGAMASGLYDRISKNKK